MLEVVEATASEQKTLLESMNFGHLGCAQNDQPYIVPMHYAFDGAELYFLTTEGQKTEWLDHNPKVCFQVEKVTDERHWQSVIVVGRAERLTEAEEIGRAGNFIIQKHASLTPAVNQTMISGEERLGGAAIYCLRPASMTGRKTLRHK